MWAEGAVATKRRGVALGNLGLSFPAARTPLGVFFWFGGVEREAPGTCRLAGGLRACQVPRRYHVMIAGDVLVSDLVIPEKKKYESVFVSGYDFDV